MSNDKRFVKLGGGLWTLAGGFASQPLGNGRASSESEPTISGSYARSLFVSPQSDVDIASEADEVGRLENTQGAGTGAIEPAR